MRWGVYIYEDKEGARYEGMSVCVCDEGVGYEI